MEKRNGLHNIIIKFNEFVYLKNGAEALVAALFSVLFSSGFLYLLKYIIYAKYPKYTEFVTGQTTWNGYHKDSDLKMFYVLYLLVPILFVLFLYVKHSFFEKKNVSSQSIKLSESNENCVTDKKSYSYLIQFFFLFVYGIVALETAVSGHFISHKDILLLLRNIFIIIGLAGFLLWLFLYEKKGHSTSEIIEKLIHIFELMLPFSFLGYFRFYYNFESETGLIELFHSNKWKLFCIVAFLVFISIAAIRIYNKKSGIGIFSISQISMMTVMAAPEGLLSVDFFHNGEMAFPMQQLLSYHKMPYFGIDPIHGLCDYLFSIFNVVLFDGKYFSQNAGLIVANLFIAFVLAIVISYVVKNKSQALVLVWFFVPFLVEKAGVRYLIFFIAFFILLYGKIAEDDVKFIFVYALLCMVAILFNVSIGASFAVAFLPETLYRLLHGVLPIFKDFKSLKTKRKKEIFTLLTILLIVGFSYIPVFLQILRFLKENAGTTLFVNGTAIFGEEFSFIKTFAIVIPYVILLIFAIEKKQRAIATFVSMFSCMFVITNYACVRYDEGLRLSVLAVFYALLSLVMICNAKDIAYRMKLTSIVTLLIISGILVRNQIPNVTKELIEIEKIPSKTEVTLAENTVEDDIYYASGDSLMIDNLGTGFIQGTTLNSIKNIREVLENENGMESYLDLTNKVSHYVIFDSESALPFTSAYNISNKVMQDKAIRLIEEKKPHLILLSPYIRFDEATMSIRSMYFYEKIMDMGYKPYSYEDVVYLLDSDSDFDSASDGKIVFSNLCHKSKIDLLPYLWGTAFNAAQKKNELSSMLEIEEVESYELASPEDIRNLHFSGKNISYLVIETKSIPYNRADCELNFISSVDGAKHTFYMTAANNMDSVSTIYVVPVGSSPFWKYTEDIQIDIVGLENIKTIRGYKNVFDD